MASLTRFIMGILEERWQLLLIIILSLASVIHVSAAPILAKPTLSQLSTENGLTQDTVNDMLIDSDGFLWIATETGLNRYDGHQNKQFVGLDGEFADDGIYTLFEDQRGNLWVSTFSSGIYRINRHTEKSKRVIDVTYQNQPEWYQYASHFIPASNNSIYVALDHLIVEVDLTTEKWTSVFDLLTPELGLTDQAVIRFIKVHQGVLFIATSAGLYTKHLNKGIVKKVPHIDPKQSSNDRSNTKLIVTDSNDRFWLGTVEGLYQMSLSELVSFAKDEGPMPKVTQAIKSLNIWDIKPMDDSVHYVATNNGLFTFDFDTLELKHLFQPSDSRLNITDNDLTEIAITSNKQLWLSTSTSGVLLWSPLSMLFKNVFGDESSADQLSNNIVYAFYVQDERNLWVATNNGLNLYDLETGKIEQFLVSNDEKAVRSSGSIYHIRSAGKDAIWLSSFEGIVKFDTKLKRVVPTNISVNDSDILNSQKAYDIYPVSDDHYIVASNDKFWQLNNKNGTLVESETLTSQLDLSQFYTFIPDHVREPGTVLVGMVGELWRFDSKTNQLTKIHVARKSQSEYSIYPSEAVEDDYGTVWVSYPGHGLYGLDANTYEQKYFFDTTNLLPSNIIFSLQKDELGYIWMGSHKGILKFDPQALRINQYTTKEGLVTNEFNWSAKAILVDKKMAFGSQKGFTILDPYKFSENENVFVKPLITDVSLIANLLELGIGDKSDRTITLNHDNVGLTINYSDMQFLRTNTVNYRYELRGDVSVTYPPTRSTEVTFPQLKPGHYEFAVSRFDITNQMKGPETTLEIDVKYPLLGSPIAYLIYLVLITGLIAILLRRRKRNNDELKAAHAEALRNKNRLSMALIASNTRVWEWVEETDRIAQERLCRDLGYKNASNNTLFSMHVALIHEHDVSSFLNQWRSVVSGEQKTLDITYRLKAQDGHFEWYRDIGALVSSTSNPVTMKLVGTYSNITESINTQSKIQLFGEAFQHTRDWVLILDSNLLPVIANQSFTEALGLEPNKDLAGQLARLYAKQKSFLAEAVDCMRHLKPGEHWAGETTIKSSNDQAYSVNIGITAVSNPQMPGETERYLVILSDITQQKDAQSALVQLANYDSLTGLPNRTLLLDRLQHAFDRAAQEKTKIGLFFIDLDRFKQINDSLGHEAGDELLQTVGKRLEKLVRRSDTVARLGGDEFVVMVERVSKEKDLRHLAYNIIDKLGKSVTLSNQVVSVSASIGISLYPEDALTPSELLKNADIAMYHAKELGSDNFQFYTEHMNVQAQAKLKLENQIKQACANKEFTSYFQPIVCCSTHKIVGFEMLMRWNHKGEMIPPDEFIPVAEDIGLIESMTTQVIEQAIPILKGLNQYDQDLYFSINLSAKHFAKDAMLEEIVNLLDYHALPTRSIRFEITESALMADYQSAMQAMSNLKAKGFMIALDDFGTGYSSLKYLKDFPIDILKIDKSFVQDIGVNQGNEAIILATLRMAESLKLQCVAEGIEKEEQVAFFRAHGCKYLQGYYFSRPVPETQLDKLITESSQKVAKVS